MTQDTKATALRMVLSRLNRLSATAPDELKEYLSARVDAAVAELDRTGIHLTDGPEDLIFLVDFVVWQYQNRDKPGSMPDWLRLRRRERWLTQPFRPEEVSAGDP